MLRAGRAAVVFLLAVPVFSGCGADTGDGETETTVRVLGGAERVSGSAFYIKGPDARVLVDLGSLYPENTDISYEKDRRETEKRNASLPVSPDEVDAILLTHAHLDHIGRLPLMVREGYGGPVYSTPLTRDLSKILFDSLLRRANFGVEYFTYSATGRSGVVHSREECSAARQIARRRSLTIPRPSLEAYGRRLCVECRGRELDEIMTRFQVYRYREPFEISGSVTAEFYDPVHIPGSASILLTMDEGEEERTMLFSGDIGSGIDSLLQGEPDVPGGVDFLFLESTYGAEVRDVRDRPFEGFLNDLKGALENEQLVWIPAFALDRTQKVLHEIRRGQHRGLLPEMDIKLLSGTARRVNEVYDEYFDFRPAVLDETMNYALDFDELERPAVVVSASYIDGIESFHEPLRSFLASPDVLIMTVGYHDPRSLAGLIQDTETGKSIRVGDEAFVLEASVKRYEVFSGHADRRGLLEYARRANPREAVILKHGRRERMEALRPWIEEKIDAPVLIPREGEAIR